MKSKYKCADDQKFWEQRLGSGSADVRAAGRLRDSFFVQGLEGRLQKNEPNKDKNSIPPAGFGANT